MLLGAVMLVAACGPKPSAQVEKVELFTVVGDYGMMVDAIERTVSNPVPSAADVFCTCRLVPLLNDYSEGAGDEHPRRLL